MGFFDKLKDLKDSKSSIADKLKDSFKSKKQEDPSTSEDEEVIDEAVDKIEDKEDNNDDSSSMLTDQLIEKAKKVDKKKLAAGAAFVASAAYLNKDGAGTGGSLLGAAIVSKKVHKGLSNAEKGAKTFGGFFGSKGKKDDGEKGKEIGAIYHFKYIGNESGFPSSLDVASESKSGTCSASEMTEAIMQSTGVDKARASAMCNGMDSLRWKLVSYTYINNGSPGQTVTL